MPEPIRVISQPTWGDPDVGALERLTAALGEGGVLLHKIDRDELTIVVAADRWVETATYLRDEEGYDFLSDVVTADWLGYGGDVAGYWGTNQFGGRDLNRVGSWGNAVVPKPLVDKRFSVSCHLLKLITVEPGAHRRVRIQAWLDDGEEIATLIPVYPSADYHEREAYDMMGVRFTGHPNLVRILLPDYWAGHPHRKDSPVGGEPVQFSDEV
jgi:NADH:ubiquinone oxidoreductase subunit C